jgi:hypothetical protein
MIFNPPTNNILNKSTKDNFWEKVRNRNGGECWVWDGAQSGNGYGQFRCFDKTMYAHIISWIMHYGLVPEGKFILHKCDNKRCVNPLHLYTGNRSDNANDWVSRSPNACKGKRYSKFSSLDVLHMKDLRLRNLSYERIGIVFKVDAKTVWNILNGRTTHFAEDRK